MRQVGVAVIGLLMSLQVEAPLFAASERRAPIAYRYAYVMPTCAPWDGPGIEVYLLKEPVGCGTIQPPYISAAIWRLPVTAPAP